MGAYLLKRSTSKKQLAILTFFKSFEELNHRLELVGPKTAEA
jgi:hypothetical protein